MYQTIFVCRGCGKVRNKKGHFVSVEWRTQREIDRGLVNVEVTLCICCDGGVEVTSVDGEKFVVDRSDDRCLPYGFKYGDKVITSYNQEVTIMGVAPAPEGSKVAGQDVLWYKKKDGKTYYFAPGNLFEAGFRLKSESDFNPKPSSAHLLV